MTQYNLHHILIKQLLVSCLLTFLISCEKTTTQSLLPNIPKEQRFTPSNKTLFNAEAPIPPMCYTKTEGKHNPCYVCHQVYTDRKTQFRGNGMDDGGLQGHYQFSDVGIQNHWKNLFVDRTDWLESISDENIIAYVDTDNYSELKNTLKKQNWQGYMPDLNNYQLAGAAFNENGFAKDDSRWVAFNYKPLPSTFWPTNGSTDDVAIRLPKIFSHVNGKFNATIYRINLAIIEMTIKNIDIIEMTDIDLGTLPKTIKNNLPLNGSLLNIPKFFVGDAESVPITPQQYPEGTEFIHSVRYLGITDNDDIYPSKRMKELRYMKKIKILDQQDLRNRYARERKEKRLEELPSFVNHADQGMLNGMGWKIQGFIEDYNGELRPQTYEEQFACMGCHAAIGTTIDQTFSFARKIIGDKGWGYINLKGMSDAPSLGQNEGEIEQYLRLSGGGHEFRENNEILEKWFNSDGSIKSELIKKTDVYTLITPSRQRALNLNKAYTHIVRQQNFIFGRDASWLPANNVYQNIDESVAPLKAENIFINWDIRLQW